MGRTGLRVDTPARSDARGRNEVRRWIARRDGDDLVVTVRTPWTLRIGLGVAVVCITLLDLWAWTRLDSDHILNWLTLAVWAGAWLAGIGLCLGTLREEVRVSPSHLLHRRPGRPWSGPVVVERGRGVDVAVTGRSLGEGVRLTTGERDVEIGRLLGRRQSIELAAALGERLAAAAEKRDHVVRRVARQSAAAPGRGPLRKEDIVVLPDRVAKGDELEANLIRTLGSFGWYPRLLFLGLGAVVVAGAWFAQNPVVLLLAGVVAVGAVVVFADGGLLDRRRRGRRRVDRGPPWEVHEDWKRRRLPGFPPHRIVILEKVPMVPGERVHVGFELTPESSAMQSLTLELRCLATLRRPEENALRSVGLTHVGRFDAGAVRPGGRVTATFDIPGDAPGTGPWRGADVAWELRAVGSTSGGAYDEVFPMPVFDRAAG